MSAAKDEGAIRVRGRLPGTSFEVSSIEDLRRLIRDNDVDPSALSFAAQAVPAYTPLWEFDFPKPGHTFPMTGLELTEPFYLTYQAVTHAIRNYYQDHPDSRLLLEFMIEAFFEEYEGWPMTEPDDFAKKYLAMRHRQSKGRAYRLIGQTYLHIAWDLPRVVEKCFPLGELERLRISEADAIDHFRETNGLFEDVLYDNLKTYGVSGMFAPGGRLIERGSHLLNSVFIWIVCIRMDAFALGASLGKHHPKDRDELLEIQKQAILKAASEATKGRFGWLALIKPPTIVLSLAPLMWLENRSAMDALLILAAIIVLLVLNYASNTSHRALRIAE